MNHFDSAVRRTVAGTAALLLAGAAAAVGGAAIPSSGAAGAGISIAASNNIGGKPNILLLVTDDQTIADMAVMDQVKRRIGDVGTTFTRAFSALPLCCPARATILTGQYAQNHKVYGVHGFHEFDSLYRDNNLAIWLQDAGYNTVIMSKYLNGYAERGPNGSSPRYVPPGWTDWEVPARGIYQYFGFTMNENGTLHRYRGYQTTHWQQRGTQLVSTYAAGEKPFFMWLGFLAPHYGRPIEPDDPKAISGSAGLKTPVPSKEFKNAKRDLALPDKPSFLEKDMSDKPGLHGTKKRPVWEYRELLQQRRESLMSVDVAIGHILQALDNSGEADDTIVIFTSDNGYLIGEHRKDGKIIGYEESVGIPMMIRGPGFAPGAQRSQQVHLADLTSTIARAAGFTPPLLQDGVPLQPLSMDPTAFADRPILLQAGPEGQRRYTGIRTVRDRVLLRWSSGDTEFYNLNRDPYQLDGRTGVGETREERSDLAARLAHLRNCAGSSCW